MPQVVEPDRGQSGGCGEGAEVAGEPVWGERVTAEASEDIAAVMVAGLLLFGMLAEPVVARWCGRGR